MIWLTDKEREENSRRDRNARRRGFKDAWDEEHHNERQQRARLIASARAKLTPGELNAIIQAAKSGEM